MTAMLLWHLIQWIYPIRYSSIRPGKVLFSGRFSAIIPIEYTVPISYIWYTICKFPGEIHKIFHIRNRHFQRGEANDNADIFKWQVCKKVQRIRYWLLIFPIIYDIIVISINMGGAYMSDNPVLDRETYRKIKKMSREEIHNFLMRYADGLLADGITRLLIFLLWRMNFVR